MNRSPAVELKGITKIFGRIIANHDCTLSLYTGEILSLLGENGSGKTTLMNAVAGIYYPDEGEIFVDGKKVQIKSPHDAYKYHIGMVHQHFKLVDTFTAVENVVVGLNKFLPVMLTFCNPVTFFMPCGCSGLGLGPPVYGS